MVSPLMTPFAPALPSARAADIARDGRGRFRFRAARLSAENVPVLDRAPWPVSARAAAWQISWAQSVHRSASVVPWPRVASSMCGNPMRRFAYQTMWFRTPMEKLWIQGTMRTWRARPTTMTRIAKHIAPAPQKTAQGRILRAPRGVRPFRELAANVVFEIGQRMCRVSGVFGLSACRFTVYGARWTLLRLTESICIPIR